jgi:FtsZ-interacting cell division protein ZipA
MSTVLIVVIVVVVIVVVGLLLTLPKARERARLQKRERELDQRRDQVVGEHREEAASRERQAEVAEQRAQVAAQEAKRERAESELAVEKAKLHERGLADHELIDDDEREHFAGTSAAEPLGNEADGAPLRARTGAVDESQTARTSRVEDVEADGRREDERPPATGAARQP